jgi:homogentisate 1,2-dioxygenase
MKEYQYLAGFGNHHESEAIEGAIPLTQNVPQRVPFGLYAEQLSGTAFTAPREHNQKTWLYRIQPSVTHQPFKSTSLEKQLKSGLSPNFSETYCDITPNQLRWSPFTSTHSADKKVDFVDGLSTICGAGDPSLRTGLAIHVYLANTSMGSKSFYNADGDMLIVPQQGRLDIQTEMGFLMVEPSEIAVIPRGYYFNILTMKNLL